MSAVHATLAAWVLDWWELWAVVLAGVLGTVIAPAVVGRAESTRPLDPTLAEAVTRAGVPTDRVRVLASEHGPVAFAAGLSPAYGQVFISERLLDDLSTSETAAVVCHEYGHLERGHVPVRIAVPVGFALTWVVGATLSSVSAFLIGAIFALPATYLSVRLSRWSERDADRFAGERGVGTSLAAALVALAAAGHVSDGSRFSLHPPLSARVAALDEQQTEESRSSDESDQRGGDELFPRRP